MTALETMRTKLDVLSRRKFLTAGSSAALVVGMPAIALADTPFTTFGFKATGSTANRNMPDRLAEVKNILNYGADPSGVADSTANIQAAVDDALAAGSGVEVPTGRYQVSDSGSGSAIIIPGDTDFSFFMRGAGGGASEVFSSDCPGYLVDRVLVSPNNTIGPRSFENLSFANVTAGGGGLRVGSTIGVNVRCCRFGCFGTDLTTEDEPGVSSQNIIVDTCTFVGHDLDSIGLIMGGSGYVTGCDFNAIGRAVIVYGKGISWEANRCERCNTFMQLGVDADGTDQGLSGFSLVCMETEGVVNVVDIMGTTKAFTIGPLGCTGHPAANSGVDGYNANSAYGIRIRPNTAYFGEFVVCSSSSFIDIAGIYMDDYAATGLGKRSFVTFNTCSPLVGGGAGVPWRIPSASGWPLFLSCDGISPSSGPTAGTRYLYAGLPTGGDAIEGNEFDISDATTTTIGATVTTGGGSSPIHVRWNGTNWICLPG